MTTKRDSWQKRFEEVDRILNHLPHRYPFLMIDRIESVVAEKEIVASKNLSFNEPYLQGHFPGRPVLPGVLMVEAIAQASAILGYMSLDLTPETHTFLLVGVENAKFKRLVIPGDRLVVKSSIARTIKNMIKLDGSVEVGGEVACTANLMTALVEEPNA